MRPLLAWLPLKVCVSVSVCACMCACVRARLFACKATHAHAVIHISARAHALFLHVQAPVQLFTLFTWGPKIAIRKQGRVRTLVRPVMFFSTTCSRGVQTRHHQSVTKGLMELTNAWPQRSSLETLGVCPPNPSHLLASKCDRTALTAKG